MNELNTLELDDQELMSVVGGGCHPHRSCCSPCGGPELAVVAVVAVGIFI